MLKIKCFEEFINESYLKSGFQPLYHWTNSIEQILESDTLKLGNPAIRFNNLKSISLTRNNLYGDVGGSYRLCLDQNKLRLDGYKPYSLDELGLYRKELPDKDKKQNFPKKFMGDPKRYTKQNIYKYNEFSGMEFEFEERIFKDIKNLGKYIITIQKTYKFEYKNILNILSEYLQKYPHIQLQLIDEEKLWKQPIEINIEELVKSN